MNILYSIIEQIDSNTDGLVDFEEFVAATLHVHQLVEHDTEKWKSLSQAAFDKFDVDRDGYITSDELRMVSLENCQSLVSFFFWAHAYSLQYLPKTTRTQLFMMHLMFPIHN